MGKLPENQRPFCPVCKRHLELQKITGEDFDIFIWHCKCLYRLESDQSIECDQHYHMGTDFN